MTTRRALFLALLAASPGCATADGFGSAFDAGADGTAFGPGTGGAPGGTGGASASTGGESGAGGLGAGGLGAGGVDAGGLGAGGLGAGGATVASPDSSCSAVTFEGRTYWLCTSNRDWDEARADCQAAGAELASISTEAEQTFLAGEVGGGQWLIGLNQKNASGLGAPGVWEWSDGSSLAGYTAWGSGEPGGGECGAFDGGEWIDWSCTNGENWICESR